MKVLITGGAGFIGHHLAERLRAHDMRVLDDLSTGDAGKLDPSVEFTRGSILAPKVLDEAVRGVDVVVHLAAIASVPLSISGPERTHGVNATGTLRVLEAARRHGVGRVVLASSAAVYGDGGSNEEDAPVRPLSPYGASKVAAEAYAMAYAATWGMDVTALRLFNVYGPGQPADHPYAPVIGRFVASALAGEPLTIHGDGTQLREFVHVYTVCDLIARLLAEPYGWGPDPVNVAFGQPSSLLAVAETLGTLLHRELELQFLPRRPGDIYRSGATGRLLADIGAARDWYQRPIDLPLGLASMLPPTPVPPDRR